MAQAAQTLTPVSLELGGKDPMIVLADADLERAANAAAVSYGLNNSGQVCISVERIYVEDAVHDEFVEQLTGKVEALRQGPPGAPGTRRRRRDHLPAADRADRVARPRRGRARGARSSPAASGGEGPGRFFEPTVLTGVDHSMLCMTEETFGPTLPVMKVADAEQAVELANDGPLRPAGIGLDPRRRARRGARPAGRGRDVDASTTPSSTTPRWSCRWAAGRTRGSARATAPTASASTRSASR